MKQFLEAGKLGAPRGLKGEIRFECWCDGPEFLSGVEKLYLDPKGTRFLEPERFLPHLGTVLFKGYTDRTSVTPLVGKVLWFDRSDIVLPEGTYYNDDLIGTAVVSDEDGKTVGFVREVEDRGGTPLWHIRNGDGTREFLFPAAKALLVAVRPGEVIRIHWISGMDNWYDL